MQQSQRGAGHRVLERGEQADLVRRQALHVLAQDLDVHQLGQARQHAPGARLDMAGLLGGVADRRAQPVVAGVGGGAHVDEGGQVAQDGAEQPLVALQEAADEARGRACAAVPDHRQVGPGRRREQLGDRHGGSLFPAAQAVAVAVGQQHRVPLGQPHRIAPRQTQPAAALRDDMEGDDVLGAEVQQACQMAGIGRDHGPGFLKLGAQEHHPREMHAVEQVREQIGDARRRGGRRFGQHLRRFDHGPLRRR